jgi:hypothetical protein
MVKMINGLNKMHTSMRKKVIKTKIYSVDWIRNGFCYRTTMGCTWEDVKNCRRTAKLLGETIKYEHYDTKVDEYKVGGRGGSPRFMAR